MHLGRRGRFDEAFARLDQHNHLPASRPLGYAVRCDLTADAGRWDEADSVAAEVLEWAERAGLEALPFFARRLSGRAALAAGDEPLAVELLRSAASSFAELGARWEVARTELSLAEALVAAGLDPSDPLHDALATFERLGALREAAAVRALEERAGT